MKDKVKFVCSNCDRVLMLIPSVAKTRKACSRECKMALGLGGSRVKVDKDKVEWLRKKEELDAIAGYVKGIFAWDNPG